MKNSIQNKLKKTFVLDENMSRKPFTDPFDLKISENIGIIYKPLDYMNEDMLIQLFYCYKELNKLCKHYIRNYALLKARNVVSLSKKCGIITFKES